MAVTKSMAKDVIDVLFDKDEMTFKEMEKRYEALMCEDIEGEVRSVFDLVNYPNHAWYASFTGLNNNSFAFWVMIRNKDDNQDMLMLHINRTNDQNEEPIYTKESALEEIEKLHIAK